MESHNSSQQIAQRLDQESQLCTRLLSALNAEHEALKLRDTSALDRAVQDKEACVSELEQNELALFQILSHCGFSNDTNGFQQYLDSLSGNDDPYNIRSRWKTLSGQIAECRQLNQVNGRILNASLANTQQLLNLLNGREPDVGTYKPSGKTDDGDNNHSLAIA
jgi:flagella synthesis protein FlgN